MSLLNLTYRPPREPLVAPADADLHARDMTATFSAGMTLGEAQRRLGETGQWLPIDGDPAVPLGELVESNSTGPLRLGYGAWRDLLLGVQFRNGKDELVTAGGRTVKNVAGYDLTKFMVGQRGVFGKILTLTTRTYRRPPGAVLARHRPDPAVLPKLLPTDLRPQWAALTPKALYLGYVGDETTTDYYLKHLPTTNPQDVQRRGILDDMNHRAELWVRRPADGQVAFRASVPPARTLDFARGARLADWCADAAFGIVVGTTPPAAAPGLESTARAVDGTVTFGSSPESTNEAERRIIEELKRAFDPDNKLAPLPRHTR